MSLVITMRETYREVFAAHVLPAPRSSLQHLVKDVCPERVGLRVFQKM